MTFRPDANLDPGQVSDRRGRRVSGGGLAMGGGIGGIILMAAIVLLSGGDLGDVVGGLTGGGPVQEGPVGSQAASECDTGAEANERLDCRIVGTVNSVQAYWTEAFQAAGQEYQPATTVLFTDQTTTACGGATSAVGPFYCPLDQTIYIDLGFYDQLESRFGAGGGVQNLLGFLEGGRDAGEEGGAVRVELQADCYAGVWAGNAVDTGYLEPLTQDQINQALDAASAIGDDRIQEQTQGQVNPETWTHGSSEQRQEWFTTGLEAGNADACDTFNADL